MKGLSWLIFAIAVLTLQFAIFPRVMPAAWAPDLLLTIVVVLGMFRGAESASAAGLFLGILSDTGLGVMLGTRALIWTQLGLVSALVGDKMFIESRIIQTAMVGGCAFLSTVFSMLLSRAVAAPDPILKLMGSAAAQALVTAMVSVVLIHIMTRLGIVPEQRHE